MDTAPTAPPALRVVRGDPTPDELAALTAVVLARGAAGPPPGDPVTAPVPAPGWLRPGRHHPAGAWRTFPR
ncbi:acyl-CoA carboxylase subunit epsilon [Streptomyces rubradiris]|nr:acyl-CoA carboxylase subunit epsilon [Streptomyces rubradiris]